MLPELITLGFVGTGAYGFSRWYRRTRPVIEGTVAEANLRQSGDSEISVDVPGRERVTLHLDTGKRGVLPFNYCSGPNYHRSLSSLEGLLRPGTPVRAKVHSDVGSDLVVYSLESPRP